MDHMRKALLDEIYPGVTAAQITVRVDRLFRRENIRLPNPNAPRPVKEVVSVDVVLFDERGTRILAAMYTEDVKVRFMSRLSRGRCYDISGFTVRVGGQCIHDHYHLVLLRSTMINESDDNSPTVCLRLKCVSDISWAMVYMSGFFDLCGFVRYFSPVRMRKYMGYDEKELTLILETCIRDTKWAKDQVQCYLRGSWVEDVERKLMAKTGIPGPVFVFLRYVISTTPTAEGCPTVSSMSDATTFEIDPNISQVQSMKELMKYNYAGI